MSKTPSEKSTTEQPMIPYIAYEGALARNERTAKIDNLSRSEIEFLVDEWIVGKNAEAHCFADNLYTPFSDKQLGLAVCSFQF